MTETELKLIDAQTQLKLAARDRDDEAIVRSCINAFICLARSVTFVMQAESGGEDTALGKWYRARMDRLAPQPLFKFFHEKRTYSVHKGTVQLRPERFGVFAPARTPQGNAVFGTQALVGWLFEDALRFDLHEKESALALCSKFYEILEQLVQEWLTERR